MIVRLLEFMYVYSVYYPFVVDYWLFRLSLIIYCLDLSKFIFRLV